MTTYKRNRPTIRSLPQCCMCVCVCCQIALTFSKRPTFKKKKELNAGTSLPYNTIRTSFFPGQKYVNFVRNSSSSSKARQARQKFVRCSSEVRQKFLRSSSEVHPNSSEVRQVRQKSVQFVRSSSSSSNIFFNNKIS